MGAGIALKNSFSARDTNRLREIQQRWVGGVTPDVKRQVKEISLATLGTNDSRAGAAAGQFVAAIAAIEIPRNEWPELMQKLVENVGQGDDNLKQASLTTIGFICDTEDTALREALASHSNSILTAVVQGARKEETNLEVRNSAITALSDSLEFVRSNFENEGERNYIMQVVCEATQANDTRIQAGSFGCLNRIMGLYYDKMKFYMERALYGLTVIGMKNEDEDVSKLAVEFWCTVCEEEISIEDDNLAAREDHTQAELRPHYNFARVASNEVVPTLLQLLTKQDEDATDDEYNVSRAAYQCLQLFAQAIGGQVIDLVLQFVESNLNDEDWHKRDAAVSAFGAIMDGPDENVLTALAKQALPLLMSKMEDPNVHVRDSSAYALGRVCEVAHQAIGSGEQLSEILRLLFKGISENPRMATSCCWALMSIAENFAGEPGCATNALSPDFNSSCKLLLDATEKPDVNNTQLLIAAYEVLSTFVTNAANEQIPTVAELSKVILERLKAAVSMNAQVVSVEDRIVLEELQTSLVRVILQIIQRLEGEISGAADQIMETLLSLLGALSGKSSVPEDVFAAIGALANSLDADFLKYMELFTPYLYAALKDQDSPAICAMAIGLTGDIVRALGEKAAPYCNDLMNLLLEDLKSTTFDNRNKPAILQCFGDIAQAIGPQFEAYLDVVGNVLQQAANLHLQADMYDMLEYSVQLRESIMDAWSGIIQAMKQGKGNLIQPYVEPISQLIALVAQDTMSHRSEPLLRSTMGVIGDLADTFPDGDIANFFFRQDWLTALIKETRTNREFSDRTRETARWAKEQVKRQIALGSRIQGQQMS